MDALLTWHHFLHPPRRFQERPSGLTKQQKALWAQFIPEGLYVLMQEQRKGRERIHRKDKDQMNGWNWRGIEGAEALIFLNYRSGPDQ